MSYPEEMANKLNDLLEKNYDTEKEFRKAGDDVQNGSLKNFFLRKAQQRYDFGHELKTEIDNFGERPDKGTGVKADLQRSWMNLKAAFSHNEEKAVLEEVQQGENRAMEEYNAVLKEADFPASTQNVLMRQRNEIQDSLQEVEGLKTEFS